MNWLQRLGAFFGGARARGRDPNAIVLYVRCKSCGEVIRVRADRRWDLVPEWDDPATAYTLRKDVLGSKCNRTMSIHVTFDRKHTIIQQGAEGATFATPEEYATIQGAH